MAIELDVLKGACDQANDAIYITTPDATIVYANEATVRITGYDKKELIGGTPSLFASGLTSREYYQRMWQTLISGTPWREAITNRRADGELYECTQTLTPFYDNGGVLNGFIAIQRDMSERGSVQYEMRSARSEVERALEEKDTLLREITHRTKNDLELLRSILSLQTSSIEHEEAQRAVAAAEQRVAVMGRIYSAFHESGIGARMTPCAMLNDLSSYWRGTLPIGQSSFTFDCEGVFLPERVIVALGIITNEIVTNVAKYANVGGATLHVSIDVTVPSPGMLRLTVTDDGPGFPREVVDGSKRGLGLTMTTALAEQYDGSLTLKNRFEAESSTPIGAQTTVILRGEWDRSGS
jgi:PAS domain S-box-containing protein